MNCNKSLLTNGLAAATVAGGMVIPNCPGVVQSMGLFALSGAVTNWLAIHMLFEKVPGLYGSGVVPSRFEDFKAGIRQLILEQFFTRENLASFFAEQEKGIDLNPEKMVALIDPDALFEGLKDGVKASPLGGMLGMLGGEKALEPLREPLCDKVKGRLTQMFAGEKFKNLVTELLGSTGDKGDILAQIESIIDRRLEELTPWMVKEIIQRMIRQHLGWLVVWGGVFGGLIGLVAGLFV